MIIFYLFVFLSSNILCQNNENNESMLQIIQSFSYPVEIHNIVTADGYVLKTYRIPYGRKNKSLVNRPIVLLQHGLLSSSIDWVVLGPNKSLGFLLVDRGYDVWMGNSRGNIYSRKHTELNPNEDGFWDFTWHEMGVYDIPAVIDYVLNITGHKKLFYIGHSQGTTIFYVMCSMKPEYNKHIQVMFSLAPSAYMSHMTSPLFRMFATSYRQIDILFRLLRIKEFMPAKSVSSNFADSFCTYDRFTTFICQNIFNLLFGFNDKQQDKKQVSLILKHTPAGASAKQILHHLQEINSGEFRQYDYGLKNLWKYQNLFPPKYNLTKITAPVYLFYSHNDWLSAEKDVLKLHQELANPIGFQLVSDDQFNHLDYIWAKNANKIIYNKIFQVLSKNYIN